MSKLDATREALLGNGEGGHGGNENGEDVELHVCGCVVGGFGLVLVKGWWRDWSLWWAWRLRSD